MMPSRRRFLRQTLFGTAALTAARPFTSFAGSPEEPPDLRFFSAGEHAVIAAVASRLLGIDGDPAAGSPPIDVAHRADRFLAAEDPEIQDQLHLLLTIFNSEFAAVVFALRFTSFIDMQPQAQDEYLEGWMTSRLGFRRTGFQALKRLCMSMYYTHPSAYAAIGYTPALSAPEER